MVKRLRGQRLIALKQMAKQVYSVVHPLLGSSESGKILGSGFGGDKTRLIDAIAEETIVQHLRHNCVSCTFVGEERGVEEIGDQPDFYLITDAVDGTTNAVRGIGFVSASFAVSPTDRLDDLEAAVVIDLSNGAIFEAEKGKGARYRGKKIKPSDTAVLEEAVVSVDVSRASETVDRLVPLMKTVKSVRSLGSAALEICQVASGFLDAYVDIRSKLRTLDIAAGMLILKEAGGLFIQPDGGGFEDVSLTELKRFSVIAAANEEVCKGIVSLLRHSPR